jgi:hypothetical protein
MADTSLEQGMFHNFIKAQLQKVKTARTEFMRVEECTDMISLYLEHKYNLI